jgi:hypothetical protein
VALALFGLAIAFALMSHETGRQDSATLESASCGSPLFPVDTWGDCIARRDRAARLIAGFGVGAVGAALTGLALVRRSHRSIPVGPASVVASARGVRMARIGGAAVLVVALALVAAPVRVDRNEYPASGAAFTLVRGRSCGNVANSLGTNQPVDEFGNSDGACLDAYQLRWAAVGTLLAAGTTLLILVRTIRRRAGTATTAFDVAATVIIVGSVALVAVTIVNHFTAARGGA